MRGALLINLGTPDSPAEADVRRYLAEFLADPRVLTMPAVARWLLLHCVILRTRPAKSASAYAKIWNERGSPLRFHSEDLAQAVQAHLGAAHQVALAFRYGQPSIGQALDQLIAAKVDEIVVLALYPQVAESTTGSSLAEYERQANMRALDTPTTAIEGFFLDPGYIQASAAAIRDDQAQGPAEHLVLSFHGLPQSHLDTKGPEHACLLENDCCDVIRPSNARCYRAQCFATGRAIARELGLPDADYTVAFQSRLGRAEWIHPYTTDVLEQLAQNGVKTVRVACPSFVADCLETLEEVAIGYRERFLAAGGHSLFAAPSLNARSDWVDTVARLLQRPDTAG